MEAQPHLIKGLHADYKPAIWSGVDESGIQAIGPHVIVLCDECSDVTSGGVALPIDMVEKMNMASEQGVIVACGGSAFSIYEDGRAWRETDKPQPGDRVYFDKYAGRLAMGTDGRTYRVMTYQNIAAIYKRKEAA